MARKRIKKTECPNCNFIFSGSTNYCPNCGQENHTHKLPIKHFFTEILEGTLHFDTKMFVTIRDLFIPGRITLNYNLNKRARYVPPVRLYIFVSFIFFLLLSLLPGTEQKGESHTENKINIQLADSSANKKDTTGLYILKQIKLSPHPDELIDSYLKIRKYDLKWYNRNFYKNVVRYNSGRFDTSELLHKLYKSISYSMFFLMPIFAFYLYLIYRRKKMFYSEHLVFAIHFHSLVFMLLCIWLVLKFVNIPVGILIVPVIILYFLISLRKVYSQGWGKTIVKFMIISIVYTLSILNILFLGVILSVFV